MGGRLAVVWKVTCLEPNRPTIDTNRSGWASFLNPWALRPWNAEVEEVLGNANASPMNDAVRRCWRVMV
jgi:hypothetical protein